MEETLYRGFHSPDERMSREIEAVDKMNLKEIRESYRMNLEAFNRLSPIHPQEKIEREEIFLGVGIDEGEGDERIADPDRKKMTKVVSKAKEAADRSGSVQVWHRGEPLDNLGEGMRERIERAIKLGF
jgi:hypothetical protein